MDGEVDLTVDLASFGTAAHGHFAAVYQAALAREPRLSRRTSVTPT
jgi:hypothetical protein